MKTINDLKDELSIQFSSIMDGIEPAELDLILTFILTSFAYDFPEVSSRAYKLNNSPPIKLYLEEVHEEFTEIKFVLPMQKLATIARTFYNNIYAMDTLYTQIEEVYAIQLTSQYIESMSAYTVPRKPMIMSDDTGDYITIDRDLVVVYTNERIIDPNNIKEYVYSALRLYAYYKFTDFVVNRQFSNLMEVNKKVFDLIYGAIDTDMSNGDLEAVTSVSLSGLSVSFASKLTNYSSTLSNLASSFNNPAFISEMNAMREKYLKKFKRKKNVFYNYLF